MAAIVTNIGLQSTLIKIFFFKIKSPEIAESYLKKGEISHKNTV